MGMSIATTTTYSGSTPANVAGTAAVGTEVAASRGDHVHTIGAGVVTAAMLAAGAQTWNIAAARQTVSGGAVASISFTSIATGYRDLLVLANILHTTGNILGGIRLNNDSGANYVGRDYFDSAGTWTAQAGGTTYGTIGEWFANSEYSHIIHITNDATTTKKYSTLRGGQTRWGVSGGYWNSTAEVNRVDLITNDASATINNGSTAIVLGLA